MESDLIGNSQQMTKQTENTDARIERARRVAFVALWLLLPVAAIYTHHLDGEFITLTLIALGSVLLLEALVRSMSNLFSNFSGTAALLPVGGIALKYAGISNPMPLQIGWFAVVMLSLWCYAYCVRRHPLSTGVALTETESPT